MARTDRAGAAASHTPGGASATTTPAPAPETYDWRRTRHELEQLLIVAHRRLDARGVPRVSRT